MTPLLTLGLEGDEMRNSAVANAGIMALLSAGLIEQSSDDVRPAQSPKTAPQDRKTANLPYNGKKQLAKAALRARGAK